MRNKLNGAIDREMQNEKSETYYKVGPQKSQ